MATRPDAVQGYRAAYAHRDLAHELEALAARAWPALTMLDVDGWRLRATRGLTRRGNSVWPRPGRGSVPIATRLHTVERFYATRDLPPCFQLTPTASPAGLDRILAARGYASTAPLEVRVARVAALAGVGSRSPGARLVSDAAAWLPLWARAAAAPERHVDTAARVLARVAAPSAYAVAGSAGSVAVARGVLDGGWLGIDLLAAEAGGRQAAVGHALLGALGRWAEPLGAVQAYVDIDGADPAAGALSTGAGLRPALAYRFRVLPRRLPAAPRA